MKCFFQPRTEIGGWGNLVADKEEWFKGNMYTLHGNIYFAREVENLPHKPSDEIRLSSCELNFHASGLTVTGYHKEGENAYKIVTVEVRTTKPRPR